MRRFVDVTPLRSLVLILAAAAFPAGPSAASTAEDFLNAPVWYLEYEVSFKSTCQGTYKAGTGTMSFTSSLERVFSGSEILNLRSQGPGPLSMQAMTGASPDGSQQSVAEAQKLTTQMMSRMNSTANWLVGGAALDENATDQDIIAGAQPSSPFRIDYKRVDVGKDLVDETGGKYDQTTTTTMKGTGKVQAGGFGGVIFEMDTAEKTYTISLPFMFNAQGAGAKMETVDFVQSKGTAGAETRTSHDVSFDQFPSDLELDVPQGGGMGGGAIVRGKLDPSTGKISGEQSFKAHYSERGATAPGTLVFKYTLTLTPAKSQAAR